jgi:hypothetical protein
MALFGLIVAKRNNGKRQATAIPYTRKHPYSRRPRFSYIITRIYLSFVFIDKQREIDYSRLLPQTTTNNDERTNDNDHNDSDDCDCDCDYDDNAKNYNYGDDDDGNIIDFRCVVQL